MTGKDLPRRWSEVVNTGSKAWCKRIFTAGGKIMGTVLRCVRADYLKAKRSMLNVIYIIVPLILALAFAGYFHISSWNRTLKISAFFEMLGIIYPFLVGIIVGIIAQRESQAGHYQFILSTVSSRTHIYIGELCFLLINSLLFYTLAVGSFALMFPFTSISGYVQVIGLLLLSSTPIYQIHFLCAFIFGKSASMGLGIAGSLLSAIMLTGLGDVCWQYIPWAWSVRYMDFWLLATTNKDAYLQSCSTFYVGIIINIVAILVLFAVSIMWIRLS